MIGTFAHISDFNESTTSPWNRIASPFGTTERKFLPELDMLGIKQSPPMIHDIHHLVETVARIEFVFHNEANPAKDLLWFDFWDVTLKPNILYHIADYAKDGNKGNLTTDVHMMRAVKRDFVFGSYSMASREAITPTQYFQNALANADVPRISDRSKIQGYVLNGNDIRMLYKDFNEMRRFLIPLDSVRGYNAEIHSTGKYLEKTYSQEYQTYPRMFVGPYVENSQAKVISTSSSVTWRNGTISSRDFSPSFTAKIAGDNQRLKNVSRYHRIFTYDVVRYGSPRLIFVWRATVFNPSSVLYGYAMAATEIQLSTATSTSLPVWSFNFDPSSLFSSHILPRVKSLFPDWDTEGTSARLTFQGSFIFDTGDTDFYHLCPDGWDYTPTA